MTYCRCKVEEVWIVVWNTLSLILRCQSPFYSNIHWISVYYWNTSSSVENKSDLEARPCGFREANAGQLVLKPTVVSAGLYLVFTIQ